MNDDNDRSSDSDTSAHHGARTRKEKVLHTRVPEVLAEELKRLAESMRVPVSNVVRSFLEDAVDAVSAMGEKVDVELRDLADRLDDHERGGPRRVRRQEAHPAPAEPEPSAPLEGVIGFQPMVLARDATCTLTGRALRAGDDAYLGIRQGDGPLVIVAPEAVPVNLAK